VADDPTLIENECGQESGHPSENAAVARCIRAFQRAYKKEFASLDEDDSKYPAEKAGREAYLRALPPLSGHQNICDFIACIAYADLTGIIRHRDAQHFLESAKIAVAARREPSSQPKRLGRAPTAKPESPDRGTNRSKSPQTS